MFHEPIKASCFGKAVIRPGMDDQPGLRGERVEILAVPERYHLVPGSVEDEPGHTNRGGCRHGVMSEGVLEESLGEDDSRSDLHGGAWPAVQSGWRRDGDEGRDLWPLGRKKEADGGTHGRAHEGQPLKSFLEEPIRGRQEIVQFPGEAESIRWPLRVASAGKVESKRREAQACELPAKAPMLGALFGAKHPVSNNDGGLRRLRGVVQDP